MSDLFERMMGVMPRVELDVRHLSPPGPLVKILENLPAIAEHGVLAVQHHQDPLSLCDKLREHGFEAISRKFGEKEYKILIWKKT
jgi:TusA-related sulfurtransferase